MRHSVLFATLLLTTVSISPAYAMLCPSNFNEVNYGDTLDQVKKSCGAPQSESNSESSASLPQEWNYYVQVSPTNQATLKTTIAFDNGVVTNMSVNGIGVSASAICGGNNIKVGDSQETVKGACGKPAFINQGNVNPGAATKVVDLVYDANGGSVTLEFENGVFKSKK